MKELLASLIIGTYGTPAACVSEPPFVEDTGDAYVLVTSERFEGFQWGCDWIKAKPPELTGQCAAEGETFTETFTLIVSGDEAVLTFEDGEAFELQRCLP